MLSKELAGPGLTVTPSSAVRTAIEVVFFKAQRPSRPSFRSLLRSSISSCGPKRMDQADVQPSLAATASASASSVSSEQSFGRTDIAVDVAASDMMPLNISGNAGPDALASASENAGTSVSDHTLAQVPNTSLISEQEYVLKAQTRAQEESA